MVVLQTNFSFDKTDLALGMVALGFCASLVREWKTALVNIDACKLANFCSHEQFQFVLDMCFPTLGAIAATGAGEAFGVGTASP